ncbi:hypothetical protein AB1K84_05465 [Mesobacillus foraminis]|uniref:hypothetical protein n=1 Tax=Mesobacillus foraminis TaxID=279826 RepID=UPI0039A36ADD
MLLQEEKKMKKFMLQIKESGLKEAILQSVNHKVAEIKETKDTYRTAIGQTVQTYKTVDGVFLGEVNRKLNIIAKKGIHTKQLDKGWVTIVLSRKKTNVLATAEEASRIEDMIDRLEGMENLRLSEFYSFQVKYFEKKWLNNVIRWVEIHISPPREAISCD